MYLDDNRSALEQMSTLDLILEGRETELGGK